MGGPVRSLAEGAPVATDRLVCVLCKSPLDYMPYQTHTGEASERPYRCSNVKCRYHDPQNVRPPLGMPDPDDAGS